MAENYSVVFGFQKRFLASRGSDQIPEYAYIKEKVIDKDTEGKKVGEHEEIVFKCVGSHSQSELVNSYRSTADIKEIFKRYISGDTSVLTKRVGEYLDTVGCPDNLLDAQLMLKNGELLWQKLPTDIKEKYGNNVEKFIEAAYSGKLYDDFSIDKESLKAEAAKVQAAQADEIADLKKQIDDLKRGVKYE